MGISVKKGIPVYFVLLFFHCLCIYFSLPQLQLITKLLLMPQLFFLLWMHSGNRFLKINRPIHWGLLFSFSGDLLLTQNGANFFLAGMLAFALAHICYSWYFYLVRPIGKESKGILLLAGAMVIISMLPVYYLLEPFLGLFKVPVLIYMCLIGTMAVMAVHTIKSADDKKLALTYFLPGACLFIISDMILAFAIFRFDNPMLHIPVMALYGLSQYLIAQGCMKRVGGSVSQIASLGK